VIVAGAVLLGLCVGSFLNVCILRLPRDQSLLRPRSTCPHCKQPIAWRDNIPVFSWLWVAASVAGVTNQFRCIRSSRRWSACCSAFRCSPYG
jgi:prepilin signal peptidase PulO-like enzyme (type II secretory pathway)